MIPTAQGWCTRMTQRDGMGREVGGRFRMGNILLPAEQHDFSEVSSMIIAC